MAAHPWSKHSHYALNQKDFGPYCRLIWYKKKIDFGHIYLLPYLCTWQQEIPPA